VRLPQTRPFSLLPSLLPKHAWHCLDRCSARNGRAFQEENIERRYEAKAQAVERIARQHDPAHGGNVSARDVRPWSNQPAIAPSLPQQEKTRRSNF
jgi:hypothetical protein